MREHPNADNINYAMQVIAGLKKDDITNIDIAVDSKGKPCLAASIAKGTGFGLFWVFDYVLGEDLTRPLVNLHRKYSNKQLTFMQLKHKALKRLRLELRTNKK
jgi:hypothetical protein